MTTQVQNYYQILQVKSTATQTEIKQAYRRLAKLFHPDSSSQKSNHDQIVRLNAAYEVLSDPQRRKTYDQQFHSPSNPEATVSQSYSTQPQKSARSHDAEILQWINEVYKPINRTLDRIIKPLKREIDHLAADPFDDELMENFQSYIEISREGFNQAQTLFTSRPNPANVAGVAAHLYYILNHVGDGIEELSMFTLNYDDSYLHTGQELFRIASRLRKEAQEDMKTVLSIFG